MWRICESFNTKNIPNLFIYEAFWMTGNTLTLMTGKKPNCIQICV